MPTPTAGETKETYMERCIPIVMKEGTAKDNKQAYAICNSMWEEKHSGGEDRKPLGPGQGGQGQNSYQGTFKPPMPVKGESVDQFVDRCKPVVATHGYDETMAKGCCLLAWDCWLNDYPPPELPPGDQGEGPVRGGQQYPPKIPLGPTPGGGVANSAPLKELYMLDIDCDKAVSFIDESVDLKDDVNKDVNKFTAVAIRGDKFYKGKYLSFAEIQKAHKTMDGAYHDINHWGTSYPVDGHPNIEYIIGYQRNTSVDPVNKTMRTDIIVNPEAPHYKAWKSFVDINKQTGRKPNVSVSFWASNKKMKAKDLPAGTDYTQEGYKMDDDVPVLYDIGFQALSTVFKGACDDKAGCGIGLSDQTNTDKEQLELENENIKLRILKEEKTL